MEVEIAIGYVVGVEQHTLDATDAKSSRGPGGLRFDGCQRDVCIEVSPVRGAPTRSMS